MPYYRYICSQGHESEEFFRIKKRPKTVRCWCSRRAKETFPNRFQVQTFKPYVENNLGAKPIEISSKRQRDQLLQKHGVTYDSYQYRRKPKERHVVDDLDFAEVKRVAERGKLDDGTPIQGTVANEAPD